MSVVGSPPRRVTRRSTAALPGATNRTTASPVAVGTATPSLSGGSGAPLTVTASPAGGSATAISSLPTRGSKSARSAAAALRVEAYLGSASALAVAWCRAALMASYASGRRSSSRRQRAT